MTNDLSSDPCRKIVVAIHQSNIFDCQHGGSLQNVFQTCQTLEIKVANFWLQLLLGEYYTRDRLGSVCPSNNHSYTVKLYTYDNRSMLLKDLAEGRVDIYPFQIQLNQDFLYDYYTATPLTIGKYDFYVNARVTDSYSQSAAWTFLTSPFTDAVWTCTIFSFLFGFLLLTFTKDLRQKLGLGKNSKLLSQWLLYAMIFVPLASLATPYRSLLKALVIQHTVVQPFSSLSELATLIRAGQLRILLENKYTHRYKMLTSPDFNRSGPLEQVYNAIQAKDGSLLLVHNMSAVCQLLEAQPKDYVYIGYSELLYTSCQRLCFWKYELTEDIDPVMSFALSKQVVALTQLADVISHAVPNFQKMEMNRRYRAECRKKAVAGTIYIDKYCLQVAFGFLGVGALVSTLLIFSELSLAHLAGYLARRFGLAKKARVSVGSESEIIDA